MAIIIDRTITIKDDKATLDRPLYLYIGDGDITCLFTIEEKKKAATFGSINKTNTITENASYGEVRIYKPDKGSDATSRLVFTERAEIIDDKLQVIFSYKNIDDFSEAGVHKLQIHLYDDDDSERNRFTIPPIDINVLLPVGYDNNATDEAIVGYSLLDARGEEVPTFDEEGNYNVTVWETGDIITKDKLNKLEDALYQVTAADDNFVTNEVLEAELANKADEDHSHKEYATKAELNNKANANHSHTNYAATNHSHSGYASSNHTHSEYATTSQLRDHSHSGYALTSHTHDIYASKSDIPTRVSQLANDKGYITSAEIPANYVTESELSSYNYITKNYVDSNFASTDYVINAINNAQLSGGGGDGSGIDLSVYALKSQIPTRTSDLINNSGFVTSDVLSGYASKDYVINTIDERIGDYDFTVDLSEYAKIENVPTKVTDLDDGIYYATKEDVNEAVKNVQVDINLDDYATIEAMNEALANKADNRHEHEDYALKTDIPELVVIPENVSHFNNDAGYITKSEVPTNVIDLEDHENYALKTDIPDIPTNVSEFANDADYATNDSVNAAIDIINSNLENNYAQKIDIPTSTNELTNDSGYITSNNIIRIEIVADLPSIEEPGVLYIVKR